MKKTIFLIILTLSFMVSAKSECSYGEVAKMKSLVNNINISYDYHMKGDTPYFDVTINNITPDMYFVDNGTRKTYNYSNTNNGEITIKDYYINGGTYLFYSANSSCYGRKLGSKYYNFPKYNMYYDDPICENYKNLNICKKWTTVYYSYSEIKQRIKDYEKSLKPDNNKNEEYEKTTLDKIVDFYIKYYVYILVGIIVIFASVVLIERKTNRFKI